MPRRFCGVTMHQVDLLYTTQSHGRGHLAPGRRAEIGTTSGLTSALVQKGSQRKQRDYEVKESLVKDQTDYGKSEA